MSETKRTCASAPRARRGLRGSQAHRLRLIRGAVVRALPVWRWQVGEVRVGRAGERTWCRCARVELEALEDCAGGVGVVDEVDKVQAAAAGAAQGIDVVDALIAYARRPSGSSESRSMLKGGRAQ